TVSFQGGGTGTGPWTVEAPATLNFAGASPWNLNAGSKMSGAGRVQFDDSSTVNLADTYSVEHTQLFQANGSANFNANSSTTTLLIGSGNTGGILGGSGNFTVNGLLTWQSGTMTGTGATVAKGGISLDLFGNATLNHRQLDNNGVATWTRNGSFG